jgi:6-phosphogluconolactonase
VFAAESGRLKEIQSRSTLPADYAGNNTTAEILIDQAGRFLYVSNRGHGSIAVFAIGPDCTLSVVEHAPSGGRTPRNFSIDPTGQYVFSSNQDTNTIAVLRIDAKTGRLAPTGVQVPLVNPGSVAFALQFAIP